LESSLLESELDAPSPLLLDPELDEELEPVPLSMPPILSSSSAEELLDCECDPDPDPEEDEDL
jgi:hypothetical protein